jgi:hypothetical protein
LPQTVAGEPTKTPVVPGLMDTDAVGDGLLLGDGEGDAPVHDPKPS